MNSELLRLEDPAPLYIEGCQLAVTVAGITVAFSFSGESLSLGVPPATRPFLSTSDQADLDLTVRCGTPANPPGRLLFDSGSLWQLLRDGDRLRFSFTSPVYGSVPYTTATVDEGFTRGEVWLHPVLAGSGAPVYPLQYPLDELLFVNLLARGRGIELHACGIVDGEDNGLLFVGHSGAGKSTTAGLWAAGEGVRILSDDRVVLRVVDGRVWMFGTPWHGEARHARPEGALLRRVLVLEHGPANQILPLHRSAAVSALMSRSFVPFHSAPGLEFALSFLSRLVEEVPCETLRFVPDREVVALVRRSHPWAS